MMTVQTLTVNQTELESKVDSFSNYLKKIDICILSVVFCDGERTLKVHIRNNTWNALSKDGRI